MPRLTNQNPESQVNTRYYFKPWSRRRTHWVLFWLPDRWLWWVSVDQFRAPSFQPDWSPFYFAHIATKSQSDACSFIQPDAGWIQIPLRYSRERLKRSQSFQETIIITRSLPQDEQCHYMPAEWTLSESVIHSVMWALSVLWKPACQCTVGTDAFRLDIRHVANTRMHTQDALVHTSLHIHNMSHILLSWTLNKAALWQ